MYHNVNVHAPNIKLKAEKLVVFYCIMGGAGNGTTACVAVHHTPILSTIYTRLVKINAAPIA